MCATETPSLTSSMVLGATIKKRKQQLTKKFRSTLSVIYLNIFKRKGHYVRMFTSTLTMPIKAFEDTVSEVSGITECNKDM